MSVPLAVNKRVAPTKILRTCSTLMVLACVSACASSHKGGAGSSTTASRGMYKVGNPYQIDGTTYVPKEEFNKVETGVASWYGPGFHGKSTANGERYDQRDRTAAHRTLQMPAMVRVTNLDNGMSTVVRVNDRGPFSKSRVIDLSRAAADDLDMVRSGTARVRVDQLPEESRAVRDVAIGRGGPSEQMAAVVQATSSGRIAPAPQPAPPPAPAATPTMIVIPPTATPPAAPPAPAPAVVPPTPSVVPFPPAQEPLPSAPTITTVAAAATQTTNGSTNGGGYYVQTGAFSSMDNAERQRGQIRNYGSSEITPVSAGGREVYRVRLGPYTTSDAAGIVADRLKRSGYGDARVVSD